MAWKYGQQIKQINFDDLFREVEKEIRSGAEKQRKAAAAHIYKKIKAKARERKITGNLERGAYQHHKGSSSFVGFHMPAFHAWLLEFGHYAGKSSRWDEGQPGRELTSGASGKKRWHAKRRERKWVAPTPILYPTFAEEAGEVERIMAEPWVK